MIRIKDIVGLPTLEWHLTNKRTLSENVYRYSSESFIQLFTEARQAWRDGKIQLNEFDEQLLRETDIGLYGEYEGQKVPLDLPMEEGSYEEGGEDDRKYALLRVEPRNYEDMIDKLQDMNINHNRQSDTVIKVYTDRIPDKVVYNLTHDVWVDKFVLNEASLRIEAYPEDDSLKKLLNKHNIKIKIIDDGGFMGIPEVELTGDRRDLEKLLVAKDGWGWAKDYIEESTINEAEYQGKEVPLDLPMLDEQGGDTSWDDGEGNKVTLQDILDMTKNIPQKEYPTEKLAKIVLNWDDNPEEIDRISQVEISKQYPILIMVDEGGEIQWILDGNHRAQKALRAKSETIPAKLIKPSNLDAKAKKVLLNVPMESVNEAQYQGKEVPLNKPKRGGSKKFYVYVKNKKGNVQKVSFGGTTGLNVKIDEPGARSSFAARHQCATKKDKTKPGYWSCNIGRYWKSLGGSRNFSGYW